MQGSFTTNAQMVFELHWYLANCEQCHCASTQQSLWPVQLSLHPFTCKNCLRSLQVKAGMVRSEPTCPHQHK